MNAPRRLAAAVLGAALLSTAPSLAAEPESAQALYDRGFAAFKAGRYDEACPALEQSFRIEPLPGALFTLAECEAKRLHFAAAAARYDEYLRVYAALPPEKQAKQGEREKLARDHRATIALQVAELTLVLPPDAPKETQVTRDGQPVAAAALGVPALVDPGEHVIKIQVPGAPAKEMRLTMAPGEKKGVALDARQSATSAGALIAAAPPPPGADAPSSGTRNAGIIAGAAVAGASAVAGAIFTGLWASKGSDAKGLAGRVPKNGPCPASGIDNAVGTVCGDLVAALSTQATFGSAAVGTWVAAGAVGVVTLVSALVSAPRASRAAFVVAPSVGPQSGGLVVGGSF